MNKNANHFEFWITLWALLVYPKGDHHKSIELNRDGHLAKISNKHNPKHLASDKLKKKII